MYGVAKYAVWLLGTKKAEIPISRAFFTLSKTSSICNILHGDSDIENLLYKNLNKFPVFLVRPISEDIKISSYLVYPFLCSIFFYNVYR